jgi:CRISPR-associated endoribonuclease Cas6
MRLLIELKAVQNCPYEMEYHSHLQGFIYKLLQGSIYDNLHDVAGSKLFAFSNIFPFDSIKENDIRTFLISSPDEKFIKYLFDTLQVLGRKEIVINIGYMKFKINYLKERYIRVHDKCNLITGTPITIRIPKSKYKEFGYESIYDNFTYWRNEHPVDVFITLVKQNLIRKYVQFHTKTREEYLNLIQAYKHIKLFDVLKFKKTISTKVWIDSVEQIVIGSLWEFGLR